MITSVRKAGKGQANGVTDIETASRILGFPRSYNSFALIKLDRCRCKVTEKDRYGILVYAEPQILRSEAVADICDVVVS